MDEMHVVNNLMRPMQVKLTILVIDRNRVTRRSVANTMRYLGHRVVEAENFQTAESFAQAYEPIDIAYVASGFEEFSKADVLTRFQELHPAMAVIFASDKSKEETVDPLVGTKLEQRDGSETKASPDDFSLMRRRDEVYLSQLGKDKPD